VRFGREARDRRDFDSNEGREGENEVRDEARRNEEACFSGEVESDTGEEEGGGASGREGAT